MDEFLTLDEAVALMGMGSKNTLFKFLGRHHVARYVRREDLLLTKAALPGSGGRNDLCVDPSGHVWEIQHEETEPTGPGLPGLPVRWCSRKGCPVGAVLHDNGTVSYARRPV